MNKKQFTTIIQRACTGVFFWLLFTVYILFKGLEVDHVETLIIFGIITVLSPIFIEWVHNNLK